MRVGAKRCARWIALAAVLATPSSAAAAEAPIDLGPGGTPHIALDASGTAHVTFNEVISGVDNVTHYCRLAKGATACAPGVAFPYPAGSDQGVDVGNWPLLPGDGRVLVFDTRCCDDRQKFLYTSGDGGQSFGPGVEVGILTGLGAGADGAGLYAPPGTIGRPAESLLTLTSLATVGLHFQATGTTGPPEDNTATDVITQGLDRSGSLGLSGNTLVAAWINIDDGLAYWRRWSGAGDVNDEASWLPITPVDGAPGADTARLASGPGGIYLAIGTGDGLTVRRFTGDGWSAPVTVVNTNVHLLWDVVLDPAGVLHFAWEQEGKLLYRHATGAANSAFTAPATLLGTNPNQGDFSDIRLAATGPGAGWVTWSDSSPQHVRALPIAVLPAPTRGSTVNVTPVKGTVLVKPRGQRKFVALESLGTQLPVGSVLDTKKGSVRLFAAKRRGRTQSGVFKGGQFKVLQRKKNPLTTLKMAERLRGCSKPPRGGAPKVAGEARKRKGKRRRRLFGNGHGRFRTRGRHSTATVRGTKWTVTDTCDATITKVTRGTVTVRDLVKHRTRKVRAGHRYVARRLRR